MSNYIEYNDKIAFHPGYYLKEIVDESGLTQEDFAKRLDTTPKNLSILIRGEQALSAEMAKKLSRMLKTSIQYWLNLQMEYDALTAEFKFEQELEKERAVFKSLDYKYFRENFGFPELNRKVNEQIEKVREFLNVATLSVIAKRDMAVSFRSSLLELSESSIIKANTMVQIATNEALKVSAPKFDKAIFEKSISYALTLTKNHNDFYPLITEEFRKAGVILVILPNLSGSKINGATKKIGSKIMLMVNDRRLNADTFWFTLYHEIGHIMEGDYGISFDKELGEREELANRFAEDHLIPPDKYKEFIEENNFDLDSIKQFANEIDRDPGIVLGRLQNEGYVSFNDWRMASLRHKYKIKMSVL